MVIIYFVNFAEYVPYCCVLMGGVQSIFTHTPKYVVSGRTVKANESIIGYFNQNTLAWEEKSEHMSL